MEFYCSDDTAVTNAILAAGVAEMVGRLAHPSSFEQFDDDPLLHLAGRITSDCFQKRLDTYTTKYLVEFCIIDNMKPAAAAIRHNDRYFVLLASGILVDTITSCINLTYSKSIMDYIGIKGVESAPLTSMGGNWIEELSHISNLPPPTSAQHDAALFLHSLCIHFIVNHELGHIINGHLGEPNTTAFSIVETAQPAASRLAINRCLEYDADCFAAQWTYFDCGLMRSPEPALETTQVRLRMLMLACFVVSAIIETRSSNDVTWKGSHPPSAFRLNTFASACAEHFERSAATTTETITALLERCTDAFLNGVRQRTDTEIPLLSSAHAWRDIDQQLAAIDRTWAEIRPKLEKSKLGNHQLASAKPESTP